MSTSTFMPPLQLTSFVIVRFRLFIACRRRSTKRSGNSL